MPCVPFVGAAESVFFSGQDLGPSVHEQILVIRHAAFGIAEANLVFGGGHVVVLLWISVRRLLGLLEGRLVRVVFLFSTIWIVFVS